MSRKIEDMDPAVQSKARAFIAELKARNISHTIVETKRTQIVQLAYWLQGRAEVSTVVRVREAAGLPGVSEAEAKRIVTQLDGVTRLSRHQTGHALDVVPTLPATGAPLWNTVRYATQYKAIAEVARRHGITCGQDWPPLSPVTSMGWDPPHYEIT